MRVGVEEIRQLVCIDVVEATHSPSIHTAISPLHMVSDPEARVKMPRVVWFVRLSTCLRFLFLCVVCPSPDCPVVASPFVSPGRSSAPEVAHAMTAFVWLAALV